MARIGIDIDDVLYPWYDLAHAACAEAMIHNDITPTTWWPYKEYGCTDVEWKRVLAEATVDGRLYRGGTPYPDVSKELTRLHEADHTIHLVTARGYLAHGDIIKIDTVRWLEEYQIPHDSLTFTQDKTVVNTHYFLEDNLANFRALDSAGVHAYLIDRPWNNPYSTPWRVKTLSEFVDHVLEVSENVIW